jgi:hypothetical protein
MPPAEAQRTKSDIGLVPQAAQSPFRAPMAPGFDDLHQKKQAPNWPPIGEHRLPKQDDPAAWNVIGSGGKRAKAYAIKGGLGVVC